MAASKKQQSALNRRREALLAKYSSSIEALAGIDVARSALDDLARRRKQAEDKALEKIRARYDSKETEAREDLAHQLALAREVMSARDITSETGLSAAEQKKYLALANKNDSDNTDSTNTDESNASIPDDETVGAHSASFEPDNSDQHTYSDSAGTPYAGDD